MFGARAKLAWGCLALLVACGGEPRLEDDGPTPHGKDARAFSSAEATLLEFRFDGELFTSSAYRAQKDIENQLLYTIGQLNADRSVGRLDRLELTNVSTAAVAGGYQVRYRARLPVAWGSKSALPSQYELILPRDVSYSGLEAFTQKYSSTCVDGSAHDVDSGSMWYYYRPRRSGCQLDAADVRRATATVQTSTENTTGKYPEYQRVWEDQVLKVVAIFGKNEDGATADSDAGIAAYNAFVQAVRAHLAPFGLTTVPTVVPSPPGVATPDVTFHAALSGGRKVQVVALLVDNVRIAGPTFDARYESLSSDADVIAYNGHAGLGANVRALAGKGRWVKGKYVVVFMNGCDTFAYVDGALAQTRAAVNPDDVSGTKYMDMVTNAMPSFFHSNAGASMALISGLMKVEAPLTYEAMFRGFDRSQVVVVTGEEDNVFAPGATQDREVLRQRGTVLGGQEVRFETAELPAGRYTVRLAEDATAPGGDADLYVRAGAAPTPSAYDCRPYLNGSNESCPVTLSQPGKLYLAVRGYAAGSSAFVVSVVQHGAGAGWTGFEHQGTVAKAEERRYVTPAVPPGRYVFELSGTGDADLYVKTGAAPTLTAWDCRPYRSGSQESCVVTVSAPSEVHVMVRGYAASSSFKLVGRPQ